MPRTKPFPRLEGHQLDATHPERNVWLAASAGTGKTQVLTARVLRLLLAGNDPATILCLTFTKAGVAEMADRIHAQLARWVRLDAGALRKELFALGEPHDDALMDRARTLFARVLDAPGGGLRIQTIHAFCQTLLAGFPAEAGLAPGFRPIEGREEAALARATLAELLVRADEAGDHGLIADVQRLSRRLGEGAAEAYLLACARDPEALAALGVREGIAARLRDAFDVGQGDVEEALAGACADERFDCAALRDIAAANARWGTKGGLERADTISAWLAMDGAGRAAGLEAMSRSVCATKDGALRSFAKGQAPQEPGYAELAEALHGACAALGELRRRAALAEMLASALRAGQTYALAYADAKRAAGVVDFDDLIRATIRLLETPGMGDWVRYKLDAGTDHILVDEAQDTNARQWAIVAALAGEYFAGASARGGDDPDRAGPPPRTRTMFTVGDHKQAIFSFQGTDPQAFRAAKLWFADRAAAAKRHFLDLALDRSYRSTPPVLELVDRLLGDVGAGGLGIAETLDAHLSARGGKPGTVTLWRPFLSAREAADGAEDEEGWLDDTVRGYARRLAAQIAEWLAAPLRLEGLGRALRPEDILILVRKRGALAGLIVARLHAEGVPVAGVDRLRLDAPLAVKDLLAAVRFAVQPDDDLTLAALLVSPLFGWSQDALYRVAHARPATLWRALRDDPASADTAAALGRLLAAADFTTPYRYLEDILSGPLQGRARLIDRLGEEARDPIEELASAALRFEGEAAPSLQRFLDWFDRGTVEIKRDPSAPLDAVRVMTVHGAKGLQAPLVILADATGDPEASRGHSVGWRHAADAAPVPVFAPRKDERFGTLGDAVAAQAARDAEEHLRLLYVALTRAEERLVIAGALTPGMRGQVPPTSWYALCEAAMAGLGTEWEEDARWGGARHHHGRDRATPGGPTRADRPRPAPLALAAPAWLRMPAPVEARPPRPLAPSSLGADRVADPPPAAAMRDAAERGRLLHALFERLPALPVATRGEAGARWLERSAGVADADARAALVTDACAIIADPRFAAIFGEDALAEAPIAAVVHGIVVAGTVDRLLVAPDRVLIVDFKTGRRVPATADAAPEHHLRQMAAYAAALRVIFPDRPIAAALLYTAGPRLLALPPALLVRHAPRAGDGGNGSRESVS